MHPGLPSLHRMLWRQDAEHHLHFCFVSASHGPRGWLGGAGLRTVVEQAGVDRKTARRYVQAAEGRGGPRRWLGAGHRRGGRRGRGGGTPGPPERARRAWQLLEAEREPITTWVDEGLTVVKIGTLLGRRGVVVPYRTLHRFCVACCGFGRGGQTVRVADGEPGMECQIDFGKMGLLHDPVAGRRRTVHALTSRRCTRGTCSCGCRSRGPGQPEAGRRLAGLRPAVRVRHRHRPGASRQGQAESGTGRAVRAVQLLARGTFVDLAGAQIRTRT